MLELGNHLRRSLLDPRELGGGYDDLLGLPLLEAAPDHPHQVEPLVLLDRVGEMLVESAYDLGLGKAERGVSLRLASAQQSGRRTDDLGEPVVEEVRRLSGSRQGDHPDVGAGHGGLPRVQRADHVLAHPEPDPGTGRSGVGIPDRPQEVGQGLGAAHHHHLLPVGAQHPPEVAHGHDHDDATRRERVDQPLDGPGPGEREHLLGEDDGGCGRGSDRRSERLPGTGDPRVVALVGAADPAAHQVVDRQPGVGVSAAGHVDAKFGEGFLLFAERTLERAGAGLAEPDVNEDRLRRGGHLSRSSRDTLGQA